MTSSHNDFMTSWGIRFSTGKVNAHTLNRLVQKKVFALEQEMAENPEDLTLARYCKELAELSVFIDRYQKFVNKAKFNRYGYVANKERIFDTVGRTTVYYLYEEDQWYTRVVGSNMGTYGPFKTMRQAFAVARLHWAQLVKAKTAEHYHNPRARVVLRKIFEEQIDAKDIRSLLWDLHQAHPLDAEKILTIVADDARITIPSGPDSLAGENIDEDFKGPTHGEVTIAWRKGGVPLTKTGRQYQRAENYEKGVQRSVSLAPSTWAELERRAQAATVTEQRNITVSEIVRKSVYDFLDKDMDV